MALVPGFHHFGWKHSETGVLRATLEHAGVVAPHTGAPYSEEMLLGLGGGVGCIYFVFEFTHSTWFTLFTRYAYGQPADFVQHIVERVGATAAVSETGSRKVAFAALKAALDAGRPAIVMVDMASLPYYYLPPEYVKYMSHVVLVCGIDEAADQVYVGDRGAVPFAVTLDELADARAAITANKNRLTTVAVPRSAPDLRAGVIAGIHDCCDLMQKPRINNLGLPAIAKWADLVANERNKKGWPAVFPPGPKLYRALCDTYHGIETSGTGGGGFRRMYAGFLDEAAAILAEPGLRDVAEQYRGLARRWSDLAQAALPDSVPLLRQTRELMDRRCRVMEEQGGNGISELEGIGAALAALGEQAAEAFPLTVGEARDLYASLRNRLLALHAAEQTAVEALQRLVP
ncbi:MAG: BtrH N-terminal domain-containing protein [Anaerolineae bacterium]